MFAATRFALAGFVLAAMAVGAFAQDIRRQGTTAPAARPIQPRVAQPAQPLSSPVRTARIQLPFSATPETVHYRVVDGLAIMQGDMVLGRVDAAGNLLPPPQRGDRQAHSSGGYSSTSSSLTAASNRYWRWTDGRVPFEIDSSIQGDSRDDILNAIRDIDDNTNVMFVERRGESEYIRFVPTDDDSVCGLSLVGMQEGGQTIKINTERALGCNEPEITHEIMHALGAFHEQARNDRDRYLTVLWDNIQEDLHDQFEAHTSNGADVGPYDFGSVMHYGARFGGKAGPNGLLETLRPHDPTALYDMRGRTCVSGHPRPTVGGIMGDALCLSYWDIQGLNALYPYVAGFAGGADWGSEYYATRIAFGDIDGDGRDEIAVARYANENARVFVYDDARANYAELWRFGGEWGSGNTATSVEFGNVDGDAAEELGITRRSDSGVRVWVADRASNGSFTATGIGNSAQWGAGNYATDIAFGDIEGDGRDEVAVTRRSDSNARFFLYDDAAAGFAQLATGGENWGANSYATAAAFGDVTGDGTEELAIGRRADENARVFIYGFASRALRQFATRGDNWGRTAYVTDLAFGQIDGDQAKELGVVRNTNENARYFVFDDEPHNFRELLAGGEQWGLTYYATGIAFGDIDSDGRDEIAIARYTTRNERFWIIDDAQGAFLELWAGGNRWGDDAYATSVALGDVSGDRCADLGVARRARENMRFDIVTTAQCATQQINDAVQANRPVVRRN